MYHIAATHLCLPLLTPKDGENSRVFLMRTKYALRARSVYGKANMKVRTAQLPRRSILLKPGADPYLEWKARKQRIETARGVAREIKDSYTIGQMFSTMQGPPQILEDLFPSSGIKF